MHILQLYKSNWIVSIFNNRWIEERKTVYFMVKSASCSFRNILFPALKRMCANETFAMNAILFKSTFHNHCIGEYACNLFLLLRGNFTSLNRLIYKKCFVVGFIYMFLCIWHAVKHDNIHLMFIWRIK